jgi:hypothetical protein
MADKKISALTSASTPLAGTEVLPIVQGGATVKVAVSDLTAGRVADLKSFNLTDTSNPYGQWIWTNGTARSYYLEGSGNLARLYSGNLSVVVQQWDITTGATRINYPLTVADNVVIGTSGKGIDFSATPGTGTSELLADYEEGTWTPTWSGGSLTLANNRYTKFGRTVFLTADITFGASVDATAGALTLPFTPLGWGAGSINFTDISATASVNVDASGSLFFRSAINGGNLASVTLATTRFIFTAQYITS